MTELSLDLASKRLWKHSDYGYHLDYRLRWLVTLGSSKPKSRCLQYSDILMGYRSDSYIFEHLNNPYYRVFIDSIVNQYRINNCGYKLNKHEHAGI